MEEGRVRSSKELIEKLKYGIINTEELLKILQSNIIPAEEPKKERVINANGREFQDQYHTLDDIMMQDNQAMKRRQQMERQFYLTP